jgi:acyl-CoA dehydrogenase
MLATWLLAGAGLPLPGSILTVAPVNARDRVSAHRHGTEWHLTGKASRVPWARDAQAVVVLAEAAGGPVVAAFAPGDHAIAPSTNLAGEPRDDVTFDVTLPDEAVAPAQAGIGTEQLLALGAAMRSVQIAGALAQVLDMTVRYAQDRVQFGRPIGKFQAVQQNLAVLAGQTAAAAAAADLAMEAAAGGLNLFVIGAAKTRTGEAAGSGAAIAHQVHGAIGFTQEHMLHFSTRRLWSWRDEFGSEAEWSERVGRHVAAAGADALWRTITAA